MKTKINTVSKEVATADHDLYYDAKLGYTRARNSGFVPKMQAVPSFSPARVQGRDFKVRVGSPLGNTAAINEIVLLSPALFGREFTCEYAT